MKSKIFWKLLSGYIVLILIAVFMLNFFVGLKLRDYYEEKISERLISSAILIDDIIKNDLLKKNQKNIQQKINDLAKTLNVRITIIDDKGVVLGDTDENPQLMENHGNRVEITRALENGTGEINRFSNTLGYNMKYVAFTVKHNSHPAGIIRLAIPLTEVESQVRVIYRIVFLGGLVAMFFVVLMGYIISKNIVLPINEIKKVAQSIAKSDFDKRVEIKRTDELGVLAKSINTMADELHTKIQHLKKMDKLKTDFVANVSHELKTPLTTIKGFVETLEDGAIDDTENARRFLSIIRRHTERLDNIINDLLSLSELELKNDTITKTDFDIKELLNEVILGFGHALSERKHRLEVNVSGDDFIINADKEKVEQIIVNILDNAVKYTNPNGTIIVYLSQEKDSLGLSVEDSGIGIPDEHLNRVFERFYRVDKARSRQEGGTGLGLAIVKHVVSLHNGSIQITSSIEKGTKIEIFLPKR